MTYVIPRQRFHASSDPVTDDLIPRPLTTEALVRCFALDDNPAPAHIGVPALEPFGQPRARALERRLERNAGHRFKPQIDRRVAAVLAPGRELEWPILDRGAQTRVTGRD